MRRPARFAAFAGALMVAVSTAVGTAGAPAGAAPASNTPVVLTPRADILVDATSGKVLAGDHVHDAMHPASTAKIMTALMAVERFPLDAQLTASARDAGVETMRIGLPVGKPWPLDELLASLMMVSANDAAYTIADAIGHGNLDAWAQAVNDTAKRYGMKDSTWSDPAGLDDNTSYQGGPNTSAYDLAIAARNALTVPEITKYTGSHLYEFDDPQGIHHRLVNHNKMLAGGGYDYAGATGFKTGFTDRAQHSLVATATRNGRSLIAVILGAPDGGYNEAARLLDAGFATSPDAPGTGETLPPVAVSLYGARAADQAAFGALAPDGTSAATASGTPTGPTVPASIPVLNAAPKAAPASATAAATTTGAKSHGGGGGGGFFRLRYLLVLLVIAAGITFALRRRAVKRRRERRDAHRRLRAAKMRSGGLPVVDGRYRAGQRLGQPVESHVRVRRADADLDLTDDARESTG